MIAPEKTTDILRKAISGDIKIQATAWTYCNHVLIAGDTTEGEPFWFVFFIDCDELDYVDRVVVGNDEADFDDLWDLKADPLGQLEPLEVTALADAIRAGQVDDSEVLWARWRSQIGTSFALA